MKIFRESINAFIKLNKGMLHMPVYWQLWLILMVSANSAGATFLSRSVGSKSCFCHFYSEHGFNDPINRGVRVHAFARVGPHLMGPAHPVSLESD